MEQDAARYRWLRDHGHPDNHTRPFIGSHCQNDWGNWYTDHATGARADAMVDEAMRESPAEGTAPEKCPIGLDANPSLCSASTCAVCRAENTKGDRT
jgi:hypothetical protein